MYIIVRKDLTAGAQLAQSCHCTFSFAKEHPNLTKEWMDISNYICILEVNDEKELISLLEKASQQEIPNAFFREPDFDNALTSIALAPGSKSKKLCSQLSLALKEK